MKGHDQRRFCSEKKSPKLGQLVVMKRIFRTALSFGVPVFAAVAASDFIFGRAWSFASLFVQFASMMMISMLYALAMKATMKNVGKSVVIDIPDGESVLRESGSTCIRGKAGFPGRLALTTKLLIFKSRKIDDKDFQEEVERISIASAGERYTWLGSGNDLIVTTTDGRVFRFVVYAPEQWIADLQLK